MARVLAAVVRVLTTAPTLIFPVGAFAECVNLETSFMKNSTFAPPSGLLNSKTYQLPAVTVTVDVFVVDVDAVLVMVRQKALVAGTNSK